MEDKMANNEQKERYELIEVPTQTTVVVKDNALTDKDGNPVLYQTEKAIVELLNKVDRIDKNTS